MTYQEIKIDHKNIGGVTKPSNIYVVNTNLVFSFYIDLYYVLESSSMSKLENTIGKWEETIGKWNIKYK